MGYRLGWHPELPDFRDVYIDDPEIRGSLRLAGPLTGVETATIPGSIDLREWCSPIEDQGAAGSCHDDKTQVLTSTGWKLFADLSDDDELATVDPVTHQLTYERPTRVVRLPYKGNLLSVQTRFLDFAVTPDHTMLVRPWVQAETKLSDQYKFVQAKDLGWYVGLMTRVKWAGTPGVASDIYVLPGVSDHKHKAQRSDRQVAMTVWLQLLGVYLAEGTMCRDPKHYKIQLAAATDVEQNYIIGLLGELGLNYLRLPDRITFDNKQIYTEFERLGLKGVHAPDKFVPGFVFEQSAEHIKWFLRGHFMGDGCGQHGRRSHYTSSSCLAEDLQRLIFLSGDESHVRSRDPRQATMADGRVIVSQHPEYRVSVCEKRNSSLERKESVNEVPYEGTVYCAEVPTHHTLVTRRNGSILISGNCTAQAAVGLVEYLERRVTGKHMDGSRLFVYKVTRNLLGWTGDTGAYVRTTLKALAKFGVCPERYWPYQIANLDVEPPAFCYAYGQTARAQQYFRIDRAGADRNVVLQMVKRLLVIGLPCAFGFVVYDWGNATGEFVMPGSEDRPQGGHAVMAAGYDDNRKIGESTGALMIRNSWGTGWGDGGYGWLPYDYLLSGLASDFWTIYRQDFLDD